jgi:hypothetical protein
VPVSLLCAGVFSLCVVRRPSDGKFLMPQEFAGAGETDRVKSAASLAFCINSIQCIDSPGAPRVAVVVGLTWTAPHLSSRCCRATAAFHRCWLPGGDGI